MITKDKAKVLLMFAHSRLTGKLSGPEAGKIEDAGVQSKIDEMIGELARGGYTVDHLNSIPDGQYSAQLTYYYEKLLNTFGKQIKEGDVIIEPVIGLNIVVHLVEHRHIVKADENLEEIINSFLRLKEKDHRSLVMKMRIVAQRLIKSLESVNYTRYLKQMRKQKRK
jgi:uncharacterized protein YwgA